MKAASVATMNVISTGNYLKIEFWQITIADGSNYYFTSGQVPMSIGGNLYQAGLIFTRDKITQKAGIEVNSMNLKIEPQWDANGGPPLIAGGAFISQCRAGVLDGAIWKMSKGFFVMPIAGNQVDTSPGLVPWWVGITNNIICGRFTAIVAIDDLTALLHVQMPRNMIQAGCVHQLFDAGCTVPRAQNTYTGTLASVSSGQPNQVTTTSAGPVGEDVAFPGAFKQGVMAFTSGVLNGASFTVSLSSTLSGTTTITTVRPFPQPPSIGDSFSIVPGCDKRFATCKSKFRDSTGLVASFAPHFRGCPFVPNPETLYDGGTGTQDLPTIGVTAPPRAGSPFSGRQ